MEHSLKNARLLSRALEATGWYRCVSHIHRRLGDYQYRRGEPVSHESETSEGYNPGLPVVAFTFTDEVKKARPDLQQVAVSNLLRAKQYIIPSKNSSASKPKALH
jgi:glutamate decarboxylase